MISPPAVLAAAVTLFAAWQLIVTWGDLLLTALWVFAIGFILSFYLSIRRAVPSDPDPNQAILQEERRWLREHALARQGGRR